MTVNCVKCNAPIEVADDSPKPVLHHTWYICDACAHPQILDSPPVTVTVLDEPKNETE